MVKKRSDEEALLDEATGLEEGDEYESSVRPPEPIGDDGKMVTYSFNRIDPDSKSLQYGFSKKTNSIYFLANYEFSGGEYDGRRLGGLLGTTKSSFRVSTDADDFLRSCGNDEGCHTNRQYKEAVEQTFGPFDATIEWELYCPDEPRPWDEEKTGVAVIKGFRNFPIAKDGVTRKHEVECPQCGQFLVAKAVIKRFIVPKG